MTQDKLKQKISEGLLDESARVGRDRALGVIKPAMLKALVKFPYMRDRLHELKHYSIEHLDELLDKVTRVMQARGTKVFVANTPQEALQYIGKLVGQGLVVKSKSNAGKEIGVVHYLEEQGAKVVETDLGDRINQLDGSAASHSLAPSIHVPIERVAKLFSKEVEETLHPELEELVRAARKSLRSFLERADVGISGANAVVAETGAIVVTENEGNIRAVTSMPKIHIAIAGVEKIVPTLQDAITVIKSAAVFGVGQDIGTYVSVLSGPSRFENDDFSFLGEAQGPREMHVVFLKTGRGGYDGRGQARIGLDAPATEEAIAAAWKSIGEQPAVAEQALALECEISVMAARNPSGEVCSFPAARNQHEKQILAWSVLPAEVPSDLELHAEGLAEAIISKLHLEGLLCVELFVTSNDELVVNELAPRPHNSYHQSERACVTSQFEQAVRAACNLPLGDTSLITPAAIVNLLGDVWLDRSDEPNFFSALTVPGVRLHLYEKHTPRPGRKMGHLSAVGPTADEALQRVLEAKRRL